MISQEPYLQCSEVSITKHTCKLDIHTQHRLTAVIAPGDQAAAKKLDMKTSQKSSQCSQRCICKPVVPISWSRPGKPVRTSGCQGSHSNQTPPWRSWNADEHLWALVGRYERFKKRCFINTQNQHNREMAQAMCLSDNKPFLSAHFQSQVLKWTPGTDSYLDISLCIIIPI